MCIFQFFLTTKRNHISDVSEWWKWIEKKKYLCAFDWSCSSLASTSKCATWWWLQTECSAAMEYRSTLLKVFIHQLVFVARFIFCHIWNYPSIHVYEGLFLVMLRGKIYFYIYLKESTISSLWWICLCQNTKTKPKQIQILSLCDFIKHYFVSNPSVTE